MEPMDEARTNEILSSIRRESQKENGDERNQALSILTEKLIKQISRALLSHNLEIATIALSNARIYEQSAAFTLNAQDSVAIYQLGRISGAYTALQPFITDMSEEEELKHARDCAPKYFDQVLDYLGLYGKATQGNIAVRLGVSPSNLSNILKRLGNAGAVYCEKSGKYHFYYLTPMGLKYWKKQRYFHGGMVKDVELGENDTDDIEEEEMTLMHILNKDSFFDPSVEEDRNDDDESRLLCLAE